MSDEKLLKFLSIVPRANWLHVPSVWNEQLRQALGDNLIRVGWGGRIELTEAGRAVVVPSADREAGK
jgi:hypothetical protein